MFKCIPNLRKSGYKIFVQPNGRADHASLPDSYGECDVSYFIPGPYFLDNNKKIFLRENAITCFL